MVYVIYNRRAEVPMSVKETLRVQAYNLIKDKIINCVYRPGEMINEERLIEELNLTRTPIRDALGRLEQEGLVQIRPKRGILITPLDFQKVSDLLEARLMYETYAIREYGKCMKEEDLISCFVAIQDSMDNSDDDISIPSTQTALAHHSGSSKRPHPLQL